jgi:hypothetical protein
MNEPDRLKILFFLKNKKTTRRDIYGKHIYENTSLLEILDLDISTPALQKKHDKWMVLNYTFCKFYHSEEHCLHQKLRLLMHNTLRAGLLVAASLHALKSASGIIRGDLVCLPPPSRLALLVEAHFCTSTGELSSSGSGNRKS